MNPEFSAFAVPVVVTLAFGGFLLFFFQIFPGLCTTTKVTDRGVEVWQGLIPVVRVHYEDILEIHVITFKEMLPWRNLQAINWYRAGGKIYVPKAVLVHKRKGIFKFVVISPDDVDAFIREVKRKMPSEK
ncbi:MAG: hypothetical protein NTY53_15130 [Kiritimatiellaeota bacterium]|nr:hypothetical protein [Kiritimatiellota bacterium]